MVQQVVAMAEIARSAVHRGTVTAVAEPVDILVAAAILEETMIVHQAELVLAVGEVAEWVVTAVLNETSRSGPAGTQLASGSAASPQATSRREKLILRLSPATLQAI
jgi:hypothetical protein